LGSPQFDMPLNAHPALLAERLPETIDPHQPGFRPWPCRPGGDHAPSERGVKAAMIRWSEPGFR
jgi:hypothetical protein